MPLLNRNPITEDIKVRSAVLGPHFESPLEIRKIRTRKWVKILTLAKLRYFNVEYKKIQPRA